MYCKIIFGWLLFWGLSGALQAQEDGLRDREDTLQAREDTLQVTLELSRRLALENNESIKIADETLHKAEGEKMAARSARLPNISASGYALYNKNELQEELYLPTQVFDPATGELVPNLVLDPTGNPVPGPDGTPLFQSYAYLPLDITLRGGALAGISAEQPLYSGGRIAAANKMAKLGEKMALTNRDQERSRLLFETDRAYYTYLAVQSKLHTARKYKALLGELVKTVGDSYETGMVNRNEVLKVQVKYNDAALQVQRAETGLKLAGMSLCRLMGLDLHTPLRVEDSLHIENQDRTTRPSAIATERREYQLLENKAELARENIKLVRGAYLPQAGVAVGYSWLMVDRQDADNFSSHGLSIMATLKIPLTTFGEGKGKMAAARAEYNIREQELLQAQKLLQLENEQARLYLADAASRVEMAREALQQAEENRRVSKDHYELGMETTIDLLEANAQWQKAAGNLTDALTDYKIQESNYLRLTNQ
ncbi:TolC family protein [Geofilum rhodophaeum]|uniref:TolC family protein n=1 Tax=Geofilum rhodophaeum TaxID=1965019 RepID=UPI00131472BC|nr:TolC family protein [Geofilum rhodophaeum]